MGTTKLFRCTNDNNGNRSQPASLAQYAVFDGLSSDRITLTIDTLVTQGGGGGIGGFQIIGDVSADYNASGAEEPELPAGAILYNDFSNYIYKDYSLPAGGTKSHIS